MAMRAVAEKIAEKDLEGMEEYQVKIAKLGNSQCVDPAVTDCWYYLSRVTHWDSA